jgi:hypothetical protein
MRFGLNENIIVIDFGMFRRAVQVVRRGMASGRRIVPLCLSMMFLYQWKSIPKMLTP